MTTSDEQEDDDPLETALDRRRFELLNGRDLDRGGLHEQHVYDRQDGYAEKGRHEQHVRGHAVIVPSRQILVEANLVVIDYLLASLRRRDAEDRPEIREVVLGPALGAVVLGPDEEGETAVRGVAARREARL